MQKGFHLFKSNMQTNVLGVVLYNVALSALMLIPMIFLVIAAFSLEEGTVSTGTYVMFIVSFLIIMIISLALTPMKLSSIYHTFDAIDKGEHVTLGQFFSFGKLSYFKMFFTSILISLPMIVVLGVFIVILALTGGDSAVMLLAVILFFIAVMILGTFTYVLQGAYVLITKGYAPMSAFTTMFKYIFTANGMKFFGYMLLIFVILVFASSIPLLGSLVSMAMLVFEGLLPALVYGIFTDIEEKNPTIKM